MKKLAFLGGALGLALGAGLALHSSQAADHFDSPNLITQPMADIGDVYAWMDSTASKVNLVMTVSPADDGTHHFSPNVLYVFHVTSEAMFHTLGSETKVICKFDSDTKGSCWVGDKDYVTGDPSNKAGVSSADGKVKLYAGRRSDPFFFNLNGFRDAISVVHSSAGLLSFNAAGCPQIDNGTGTTLRLKLTEPAQPTRVAPCGSAGDPGGAANKDCFLNLDVKAIVLQVDKSLLNLGTNDILAVWGSTHEAG